MAAAVLMSMVSVGHLPGQQGTPAERLFVYLDDSRTGDRSYAVLRPDGDGSHGALVWACGGSSAGLAVGILLADSSRNGQTRRLSWRVDDAEPVVTRAQGEDKAVPWFLPNDAAAAVTARARAAQTLALRVEDTSGSRPAAEFEYTLAGLDSALIRMGCGASTGVRNSRAGGRTLRSLTRPRDNEDGSPPWPPVEVFEPPTPTNLAHFQRLLDRNYPPSLRPSDLAGEVVLRFRVMEEGWVDATSIAVMSSNHAEFSRAAIRAVQELRFTPARANGRAVKLWTLLPVHFSPPPARADTPP